MLSPIRLDKWQNIVGVSWAAPTEVSATFAVTHIVDEAYNSGSLDCAPTTVFAGASPPGSTAFGSAESYEIELIGASDGATVSGLPAVPGANTNSFFDATAERLGRFDSGGVFRHGFPLAGGSGLSMPLDYRITTLGGLVCSAGTLPLGGSGSWLRAGAPSDTISAGYRAISIAGTSMTCKGKTYTPTSWTAPFKIFGPASGVTGWGRFSFTVRYVR